MKPVEERISEAQVIIKKLISKAYDSNMVRWNDALNFPDFVHALWRLFLKHENFKDGAKKVLDNISQDDALQLIAREVNTYQLSKEY